MNEDNLNRYLLCVKFLANPEDVQAFDNLLIGVLSEKIDPDTWAEALGYARQLLYGIRPGSLINARLKEMVQ